jgi:hypothetical protein
LLTNLVLGGVKGRLRPQLEGCLRVPLQIWEPDTIDLLLKEDIGDPEEKEEEEGKGGKTTQQTSK